MRTVEEWIGATDDTPVPPRVRLRVLDNFGQRCDINANGCGRLIRPGDKWTCDHVKALINGGSNREKNLHPLCSWCVPAKDKADVAEKSNTYQKRLSYFGMKPRKGRPMIGTVASGIKRRIGGGRPIDRRTGREL